jgi:hypothetical protein
MKTLKKLAINIEKILHNEELLNLKGGTYYQVQCEDGQYWGCGSDYWACREEGMSCCDGGYNVVEI